MEEGFFIESKIKFIEVELNEQPDAIAYKGEVVTTGFV